MKCLHKELIQKTLGKKLWDLIEIKRMVTEQDCFSKLVFRHIKDIM